MTFLYLMLRLFGIGSLVVLGTAVYMIYTWWRLETDGFTANDPDDSRLYVGLALLALSLLGRPLILLLFGRKSEDGDRLERLDGEVIEGPDGARLHVERHGPAHAPTLLFTHAWGMDSTLWWDARRMLSDRFRIVLWDLPGMGRSRLAPDGHVGLDRYAENLRAVLDTVDGPAVLVGHSIGGMTIQELGRRHPMLLGTKVAGVVLENTTHTHAHRTTFLGGLLKVLRWPVVEPMMRLAIWLQPLFWAMSWQSYLSGATHLGFRVAGFGSRPTRAQLNHAALLATRNSPGAQAKGNLAMMRWSATEDLPRMRVPTLVFIGGRDLVTLPQAGELIASSIPDARAVRVGEAGHLGPVELARAYNAAIADFADQVFTRGAVWADRAQAPEDRSEPGSADTVQMGETRPRLG